MPRLLLLAFVLLLAAPLTAAQAPAVPEDAAELIHVMHDRHADTWYRTLYFTQTTSRLRPGDSVLVETWREWAMVPGRLRIEMGDGAEGNGALFANDSTYIFRGGRQVAARRERNDLLTLGFDVYAQPPEVTLVKLEEDGFTLGPVHSSTWEGRPAYVFGSPETKEVWVDAERLVFLRLVEPTEQDPEVQQDVRFTDYVPLDGGWIAPTVEVWVDGQKVFWEEYADIRTGFDADAALFDPTNWGAPAPVPGE